MINRREPSGFAGRAPLPRHTEDIYERLQALDADQAHASQ